MARVVEKPGKVEAVLIVRNDRGLHTRPSTEIVKCVGKYKSDVRLKFQKEEANAKSLLGILILAAPKGAKIQVVAEGTDAADVVADLLSLAENCFNIHY